VFILSGEDQIFNYYVKSNSIVKDLMDKLFTEIDDYEKNCIENCLVDVDDIHIKIPKMVKDFKAEIKLGIDTSFYKIYNELIVPLNNLLKKNKSQLFNKTLSAIINYFHEYKNNKDSFKEFRVTEFEQIKSTEHAFQVLLNRYEKPLNFERKKKVIKFLRYVLVFISGLILSYLIFNY